MSLEAIVIAGFFSMFLLLGGSAWLSVRDTIKMKGAILWVDQTHEITEMLKDLELDLREAESALRTYMITGDSSQRDEYHKQAYKEMQDHLRKMRGLTRDNSDQQRILDRMEPLLKKWVTLMEELRETYESAYEGDTMRQKELGRAGTKLTNKILAVFAEFVERDQQLLTDRIASRESRAHLVMGANIASGALGLCCVGASLFLILRGMNQRRQAKVQLQASLAEKEILLKEVHHRVKNNLQVISSLLSLQSEKVKDAEARIVFKECRDRIHSMARLHQQLYTQGHFASVEFGIHLEEMSTILVRSHMPNGCEVVLQVHNEPVRLDLDMAITLGLIANELILNSLKHAFVGRSSGLLTVALRQGTLVEMSISDDGNGLSVGFDPTRSSGLGLELVQGLTRQIHGSAEISNNPGPGTNATIRFPLGGV